MGAKRCWRQQQYDLLAPIPAKLTDLELAKQIDIIRRDIDENFVKLDRMLSIAKDREEINDFPVAFVTNLLYIVSINGLHS